MNATQMTFSISSHPRIPGMRRLAVADQFLDYDDFGSAQGVLRSMFNDLSGVEYMLLDLTGIQKCESRKFLPALYVLVLTAVKEALGCCRIAVVADAATIKLLEQFTLVNRSIDGFTDTNQAYAAHRRWPVVVKTKQPAQHPCEEHCPRCGGKLVCPTCEQHQ